MENKFWQKALFILIVSFFSANIIGGLITMFEVEFSLAVWLDFLKVMPFIWLTAIILILTVGHFADWLASKILGKNDSFNATVIVTTLCTVLCMSVLLTIIGSWIGTRTFSLDPILHFFYLWPRNFTIALGVELLIAQPIARWIMKFICHNNNNRL
jgi:hypothetical protein